MVATARMPSSRAFVLSMSMSSLPLASSSKWPGTRSTRWRACTASFDGSACPRRSCGISVALSDRPRKRVRPKARVRGGVRSTRTAPTITPITRYIGETGCDSLWQVWNSALRRHLVMSDINWFSFEGRATRSEFWSVFGILFVAYIIVVLAAALVSEAVFFLLLPLSAFPSLAGTAANSNERCVHFWSQTHGSLGAR